MGLVLGLPRKYRCIMTPDRLEKLLKEAREAREEIASKSASIREKLDALRAQEQEILALQRPIIAEMKKIEAPLYDLDNEISRLCLALGGKTG